MFDSTTYTIVCSANTNKESLTKLFTTTSSFFCIRSAWMCCRMIHPIQVTGWCRRVHQSGSPWSKTSLPFFWVLSISGRRYTRWAPTSVDKGGGRWRRRYDRCRDLPMLKSQEESCELGDYPTRIFSPYPFPKKLAILQCLSRLPPQIPQKPAHRQSQW